MSSRHLEATEPTPALVRTPGKNARPGRQQRQRTYAPFVDYGVECATGTKPIWLYLRLSNFHADAADAIERHRLDLQRKLAADGGWTIMGEYVDNDSASKSAVRTRRGWQMLNAAIDEGSVTAVGFWKLDRCQRVASKGIEWLGECFSKGCDLISYNEGRQDLTGAGKILAGMQMLFAEHETDVMSTRQLGSKAHAAEAGFNHGGQTPFGWKLGPSIQDGHGRRGKRLVPHPVEFPALKDAVHMALNGASLNDIAKHWRVAYGITTADGRDQYAASVRFALRSPRLVGYRMRNVPWDQITKSKANLIDYIARDANGEPVISQKAVCDRLTWERLQLALNERSKKGGTRRPWGTVPWLLPGLVFCPTCDSPLTGTARGKLHGEGAEAQRLYYDCKANKRRGSGTCARGVTVPAKALEDYVRTFVMAYTSSERLLAARAEIAKRDVPNNLIAERDAIQVEISELKRQQGSPQFRGAMVTVLLNMIQDANDRLLRAEQAIREATPDADLPECDGEELARRWESMTPDQRRVSIRQVVQRIDVVKVGRSSAGRIQDRVKITPRF